MNTRTCIVALTVMLVVGGGFVGVASGEIVTSQSETVIDTEVNETGEETLLISLEDVPVEDSPNITDESTTREQEIAQQQVGLEKATEPLQEYTTRTDGIELINAFWLGTIAVVTVDHAQFDVTSLADIDGVQAVRPNSQVTTAETRQSSYETTSNSEFTGQVGITSPETPALTLPQETATAMSSLDATGGVDHIDAPEVWEAYDVMGEDVSVAVLDSGVDPNHPDIEFPSEDTERWGEWDSSGEPIETNPQDYGTHGTHVSGTVVGGNTSGEYMGVAPDATLYHGAVLPDCDDDGCTGLVSQIVAGMQWAYEQDVDIISMSLGSPGETPSYIEPIYDSVNDDIAVVMSSGNNGLGTIGSPGDIPDGISVGNTLHDGLWCFDDDCDDIRDTDEINPSSSGDKVDTQDRWGTDALDHWPDEYIIPTVSAPGSNVESTMPGEEYDTKWGTSMAAPHVSGTMALMQSVTEQELSIDEMEQALIETAYRPDDEHNDDVPEIDGQDARYGHGIINAKAAVDEVVSAEVEFDVEIDETNTPVVAGETLAVDATVTNTADQQFSQTLNLTVPGLGSNETTVSLDEHESTTETLTLETTDGDAGDYTVAVSTDDDEDSQNVTVQTPATFSVSIDETNAPVIAGESLTVNATVENTGDVADTQTVLLESEFGTASMNVTLESDETASETLTLETTDEDAGDYTVAVSTDDDEDSQNVTVQTPATFSVSIDETNAPVIAGESLTVNATVENTGDVADTQTVLLESEFGTASTNVTLESEETTTETLSVQTTDGDAGNYTVEVTTEDEMVNTNVSVQAPANFTVNTLTPANTTVENGSEINISADIENTGDVEGNQTVTLAIDEYEASTVLTLNSSERKTATFENVDTSVLGPGEYTPRIASVNDSVTGTLTVQEPATFEVSIDSTTESVVVGETLFVNTTVKNTGEIHDTGTLTLDVDEIGATSVNVSLDGGTSTTEILALETERGDEGNYTATVSTTHDTATTDVTVQSPAVTFEDQRISDNGEVTLDNVTTAERDTLVLVTYTAGDDSVVAGVRHGTFTDESVSVDLGKHTGFPEEYSAHVVIADEANDQYQPGDTLSPETADAIDVSVPATVTTTTDAPFIIVNNGSHALDTTGDGLLNDVTGSGTFDVSDVQALFENMGQISAEDAQYFSFSETTADEVTIFDVQALFNRLE